MPQAFPSEEGLNGAVILLLADFPDSRESEGELAEEAILASEEQAVLLDEAIVSLARAVFAAGGRLAFADHPFFTPLVTQIASEYWESPHLETPPGEELSSQRGGAPVCIYRPRSVDQHKDGPSEFFGGLVEWWSERPSNPAAVVCIAGKMSQFETEFAPWFAGDRQAKVFVVPSSGGLVRRLTDHEVAINLDDSTWQEIQLKSSTLHSSYERPPGEFTEEPRGDERIPEFRQAAYPLLMARIVDEVIGFLQR